MDLATSLLLFMTLSEIFSHLAFPSSFSVTFQMANVKLCANPFWQTETNLNIMNQKDVDIFKDKDTQSKNVKTMYIP